MGEQRVYSRTNRLGNVRTRTDGESEIGRPLGGERPIAHPRRYAEVTGMTRIVRPFGRSARRKSQGDGVYGARGTRR